MSFSMKKFIKWAVIIFIAIIVFALIFGSDDDATTTTSTDNATTETTEVAEAEVSLPVTASELYSAYEGNEVAADKKYKGKLLEVTGTVDAIDSSIGDQAVVRLQTSNSFASVQAKGDDKFTDAAATLNKGHQITMICKGDGEVIGSPMLKDCVIQ